MDINSLLDGAYDLHVHTGPDLIERKLSDIEMVQDIKLAGLKGYGIKSHYFCTAERARLMMEMEPEVEVIGSISLNNSVGGLNPFAVEMAARDGAKIVWMPTVDSKNEDFWFTSGKYKKLPGWAKIKEQLIKDGLKGESLTVLTKDGQVSSKAIEVLKVIKKHGLILATGHLSKEEIFPLIDKAHELGIKKIVVTHPNFPSIDLNKEEQKELVEKGAMMEHCFTTPHTGKMTWDQLVDEIKYVGVENCILSTDLGQQHAIKPSEGMRLFVETLLKHGFSNSDIVQMIKTNPKQLLE